MSEFTVLFQTVRPVEHVRGISCTARASFTRGT